MADSQSWVTALAATALLASPLVILLNTHTASHALLRLVGFRASQGSKATRATKQEIGAWVLMLMLLSTALHWLTTSGVLQLSTRALVLHGVVLPLPGTSSLSGAATATSRDSVATLLSAVVVLLSVALVGIAFLLLGVVFAAWPPTRRAGAVITSRVFDSHRNWRMHPVRSFCDMFVWFTITGCSYLRSRDVLTAVLMGIIATTLVVLGSDWTLHNVTPFRLVVARHRGAWASFGAQAQATAGRGGAYSSGDETGTWTSHAAAVAAAGAAARTRAARHRHLRQRARSSSTDSRAPPAPSAPAPYTLYWSEDVSCSEVSCSDLDGFDSATTSAARASKALTWSLPRFRGSSYILPALLVVANAITTLTDLIYDHHQHVITLFLLGTLSGIAVAVLSELLVIYPPTVTAGRILQNRLNPACFMYNWRHHALRSLSELGTWSAVAFYSFVTCGSVVQAVKLGTIAAVTVTLVCEGLKRRLRICRNRKGSLSPAAAAAATHVLDGAPPTGDAAPPVRAAAAAKSRAAKLLRRSKRPLSRRHLPLLCFLTYFGWCVLNAVHAHYQSIGAIVVTATTVGVALVVLGELLPYMAPYAAVRLRIHIDNWTTTARAAAELGAWAFATWSLYSLHHDLVAALQWGALSGLLIVLSGEYVAANLRSAGDLTSPGATTPRKPTTQPTLVPTPVGDGTGLGADGDAATGEKARDPATAILPLAGIVCLVGFDVIVLALRGTTHQLHTAFALVALSGSFFIAAAEVLMSAQATRSAGLVLHSRVRDTFSNWRTRPFRSLIEIVWWVGVITFTHWVTGSVVTAVKLGTLCGCAFILVVETASGGLVLADHAEYDAAYPAGGSCGPHIIIDACCRVSRRRGEDGALRANRPGSKKPWARRPEFVGLVTMAELAKHSTRDDLWVAIHGQVYNVTRWLPHHPGGDVLLKFGGMDCSDHYEAFHLPRVQARLKAFHIGTLTDAPTPPAVTVEYRALRRRLIDGGFYKPRLAYYVCKWAVLGGIIAGAVATGGLLPAAWYRPIVSGALMALAWQQSAYLAHDALHNGILPPPKNGAFNPLGWLHAGVLFGISPGLWADEHNTHHAASCRVTEDPQFSYLPVWLTSLKELQVVSLGRLAKVLVPIQHWTMLPLCLLVGRLNLQRLSLVYILRHRRLQDACAMGLHAAGVIAWLSFMNPGTERVYALLAAYLAIGTLHVELLLSHLAMETVFREDETKLGFFQTQLVTSRNLVTHWYNDWLFGGLQYQIEHHCFPMLPRHRLREVVPMVHELCKRHGVGYECLTPTAALKHCMKDMKRLASALANPELG